MEQKKLETIKNILMNVFNDLSINATSFVNCHGYKVAEIIIDGVKIGVGINDNHSSIGIFMIRPKYKKENNLRFDKIVRIGKPAPFQEHSYSWVMEWERQVCIGAKDENFSPIDIYMSFICEVTKRIKIAEATRCETTLKRSY